jgi:hypothetical protein
MLEYDEEAIKASSSILKKAISISACAIIGLMKMTKTDQNGLTERQTKALPFFIASSSESAACRDAKIAKQTYYEWLKDPLFRSELTNLREEAVQNAVENLKAHACKAVDALVGLLDAENLPLRRSAANDILHHIGRFKELQEIEQRLSTLERSALP